MTILHISDTHGKHRELVNLPTADVLVHSGDFTLGGSDMEALDFLEWICDLPYAHKVFIAGNHDDCMADGAIEGLPDNVHYLADSGVTIEGVKFYGVPTIMRHDKMQEDFGVIPPDTDVLITHRPPLCILDGNDSLHVGSAALLGAIKKVSPKLHLFGHAHDSYGMVSWNGVSFSNACLVDDNYTLCRTPLSCIL